MFQQIGKAVAFARWQQIHQILHLRCFQIGFKPEQTFQPLVTGFNFSVPIQQCHAERAVFKKNFVAAARLAQFVDAAEKLLVFFLQLAALEIGNPDLVGNHLRLQTDERLHRDHAQINIPFIHQRDVVVKIIALPRERRLEHFQQRRIAPDAQVLRQHVFLNGLPAVDREAEAGAEQKTHLTA